MDVRQTKNTGLLVGTLSEKNLELLDDVAKVNGVDTPCKVIKGSITLETSNGLFKLRVYSKDIKGDGSPNGLFKGYSTIYSDYVSKLEASQNESLSADVLSCEVKIGVNDYVGKNGGLKTGTQISMFKANRVSSDTESTTDLDMEGVIRSIKPELIGGEKETGRLAVEFVLVGYGGKAEPITVLVEEDMATDFTNLYEVGQTCELYCSVIMKHIGGSTVNKPAGLGRRAQVQTGFDIMEIVVIGGEEPYAEDDMDINDNPKMISLETMKQLMSEREIFLEELEKNGASTAPAPAPAKPAGLGVKKPLAEDDCPF